MPTIDEMNNQTQTPRASLRLVDLIREGERTERSALLIDIALLTDMIMHITGAKPEATSQHVGDPSAARTLAGLLSDLRYAIVHENAKLMPTLDAAIELTFLHSDTYQLAWQLFRRDLEGELVDESRNPFEILHDALEREKAADSEEQSADAGTTEPEKGAQQFVDGQSGGTPKEENAPLSHAQATIDNFNLCQYRMLDLTFSDEEDDVFGFRLLRDDEQAYFDVYGQQQTTVTHDGFSLPMDKNATDFIAKVQLTERGRIKFTGRREVLFFTISWSRHEGGYEIGFNIIGSNGHVQRSLTVFE